MMQNNHWYDFRLDTSFSLLPLLLYCVTNPLLHPIARLAFSSLATILVSGIVDCFIYLCNYIRYIHFADSFTVIQVLLQSFGKTPHTDLGLLHVTLFFALAIYEIYRESLLFCFCDFPKIFEFLVMCQASTLSVRLSECNAIFREILEATAH